MLQSLLATVSPFHCERPTSVCFLQQRYVQLEVLERWVILRVSSASHAQPLPDVGKRSFLRNSNTNQRLGLAAIRTDDVHEGLLVLEALEKHVVILGRIADIGVVLLPSKA